MAADRRLLVSARRHADRRLLPVGRAAGRPVAARPGGRALPGARLDGMTAEHASGAMRTRIREKAHALGFVSVGFAPAALGGEARDNLRTFLARGHPGARKSPRLT